jgi:hypothetical protein
VEVIILDDHSDGPYLRKIKELCGDLQCPWTIQTTREAGQGKSLHEQFELAKSLNALCYFCEDDYLHEPSAIMEMWNFYRQMVEQTGNHGLHRRNVILYQPLSSISLWEKRHWQYEPCNPCFVMQRCCEILWHYFENTKYVGIGNRQLGTESRQRAFSFNISGFCPIPPLLVAQFELAPCFQQVGRK